MSLRFFKHLSSAVLTGSLWLLPVAQGAPERQIVDVAHSTLDFTASSFLVDAEGIFREWKGEVMLDREDLTKSSVSITILASSIDTRIEKRNEHLKSADFLEVAKYPNITFKSTRVEKTGEKTLNVTGDFTLHGVTKSLTIPVTIDRLQDNYSRFRGQVTLSRAAYGVTYNSTINPIADELKVSFVVNVMKPSADK